VGHPVFFGWPVDQRKIHLQAISANATNFAVFGEDLGSLHFLFTMFYFFLNSAWVLSKSKFIAF
jgi:hypothetical protein